MSNGMSESRVLGDCCPFYIRLKCPLQPENLKHLLIAEHSLLQFFLKFLWCVSFIDSKILSRFLIVFDTVYCIINLKIVFFFFFFLGQLSIISAGFHILADSCENTQSIES